MIHGCDVLKPLTATNIFKLLSLYGRENPKHFHVYSFLLNQLEWDAKLKRLGSSELNKISVKCRNRFYTHRNGNLERNATFVSITGEEDYTISFFSLEESQRELEQCLAQTNRINWAKRPLFASIKPEHIHHLSQYIIDSNLDIDHCGYYCLAKHKANNYKIEIPVDVKVSPLELRDASLITKPWIHAYDGAEKFIWSLIHLNGGFKMTSRSSGELLCWILKDEYGGIGHLQTIKKARGKGYGKLLSMMLCQEIINRTNRDVIAFVAKSNIPPLKLMDTLEFEYVADALFGCKLRNKHE